MEPITALALISNIIHLIDIGSNVTRKVKEIRRSANGITNDVQSFREKASFVQSELGKALASTAQDDDQAFNTYATNLNTTIDEYLGELDELSVKGRNSWWRLTMLALTNVQKQEKLQNSLKMIEQMGDQVTMHIVNVAIPRMESKLDALLEKNEEMRSSHKETGSQLLVGLDQLRTQIENTYMRHNSGDVLLRAVEKWCKHLEIKDLRRQCLRALWFEQLGDRHDQVQEAHTKTFGWIFDKSTERTEGTRFQEWLLSTDSNHNVFWITGKPGSGKSTFMKFLVHHPSLEMSLRSWSGEHKLIVAHYYFWRQGSPLQRSLDGLIRSLLYQCLSKFPELIDHGFHTSEWTNNGPEFRFSARTLRSALKNIIACAPELGVRFFILIDGLDEFDDRPEYRNTVSNPRDLIQFLRLFYSSSYVKLCVSSRPENAFSNEFGQDYQRRFCMQHLTYGDIHLYIKETLGKDETFRKLAQNNKDYDKLVEDIIRAADGVFLWVSVASQSLLRGITNADRFSDLQQRLRRLPTELDDLYEHMLHNLEPEYQHYAARILLHLSEPYSGRFAFPLTTLTMPFVYLDPSEHSTILRKKYYSARELADLQWELAIPINTYCKGFLSFRNNMLLKPPAAHNVSAQEVMEEHGIGTRKLERQDMDFLEGLPWNAIRFSHRTIADFLKTPKIRNYLLVKAGMDENALAIASAKGHIALIRIMINMVESFSLDCSVLPWTHYINDLRSCVSYIHRLIIRLGHLLDSRDDENAICLWTELGEQVQRKLANLKENIMTIMFHIRLARSPTHYRWDIIGFAIYYRSGPAYLKRIIEANPELLKRPEAVIPPLYLALKPLLEVFVPRRWPYASPLDTVEVLLQCGMDPNESFEQTTLWVCIISYCFCAWRYFREKKDGDGPISRLIDIFVRHGADVTVPCQLVALKWEEKVSIRPSFRRHRIAQTIELDVFPDFFNGHTDCNHRFSLPAAELIRCTRRMTGHNDQNICTTDYDSETVEDVIIRVGTILLAKAEGETCPDPTEH